MLIEIEVAGKMQFVTMSDFLLYFCLTKENLSVDFFLQKYALRNAQQQKAMRALFCQKSGAFKIQKPDTKRECKIDKIFCFKKCLRLSSSDFGKIAVSDVFLFKMNGQRFGKNCCFFRNEIRKKNNCRNHKAAEKSLKINTLKLISTI